MFRPLRVSQRRLLQRVETIRDAITALLAIAMAFVAIAILTYIVCWLEM